MTRRPMYSPQERDSFIDRFIQDENPLERRERDSFIDRFIDQPLELEPVKKPGWLKRFRLWPRKKKAPVVTEANMISEPASKSTKYHHRNRVTHDFEYSPIDAERSSTSASSVENRRQPSRPPPQLRREPDPVQPGVFEQPPPHVEHDTYLFNHGIRPRQSPIRSPRAQATDTAPVVRFVHSKQTESTGSPLEAAYFPQPSTFSAQPSRAYSPRTPPPPVISSSSSPFRSTNPSLFDGVGSSTPLTSAASQDECRDHVPVKAAPSPARAQVPAPTSTVSPTAPPLGSRPSRTREKRSARIPPPPVPPLVYDPIPTIAELQAGVGFETTGKVIVATLQQLGAGERDRIALAKDEISYNRAWTQEIRSQTAEYRELLDQVSRRRAALRAQTPRG